MCKVTINGHTYLGNNEDSWRLGSRIWFESGSAGKLGAVYVGYGNNFPQGGMNEAGLAFDGLTTAPKTINPRPDKKAISNPMDFVKQIMQTCKTVEDVRQFAIQYERQTQFNNGEYFFTDRAGNYLVMESDTLLTGSKDKYIIANFCPSVTSEKERHNWARYDRGFQYIRNHPSDSNSNYALALTDTMHECREILGDGTMYSFIADLDKGDFTLYFYHDFAHAVKFNLKEELSKGDHASEMLSLFPPNAEFKKLTDFKTPRNNVWMLASLYLIGGFLLFSFVFYLFSFVIERKKISFQHQKYQYLKSVLAIMNILLLYFVFVLIRNENIYYFPSPYHEDHFSLVNVAAYLPFLLITMIIPLINWNVKIIRDNGCNIFSKGLYSLHSLVYLILITLFTYWGFYNIF